MTPDGYTGSHRRPSNPGRKQLPAGVEQLSVYIPRELTEAARDAVIATTAYPGGYQGLSALVADALAEKLDRLRSEFNHGEPFPRRAAGLPRGRPRK
jgi:hypothetical protein